MTVGEGLRAGLANRSDTSSARAAVSGTICCPRSACTCRWRNETTCSGSPGTRCPPGSGAANRITPGMMRILDRLQDAPAQEMNHLGETLNQTCLTVPLWGDESAYTGLACGALYRFKALVRRWRRAGRCRRRPGRGR
ncbi:hypothetical protein GCM10018780_77760 [Streptomyces lanatus]|nr:hypothetical protein GCM10018780_77760 [Streptomyces lanatus]